MNILEVIPSLQAGGAEVFIVNLCNEICRHKGVSITLLTFYKSDNCFLRSKLNPAINLVHMSKTKGLDIKLMFQLCNLIKKGKYDVAHFHVNSITYALLPAIRKLCRCYATIHNDAFREASGIHRFIRYVLFRFNMVSPITISHQSDISFHQLYGYSISTTIIYNGVPKHILSPKFSLNKYKITNDTKIFIIAAAVTPIKNELAVVKAMQCLIDEGEDIVLVIVGREADAQYTQQIKNMTSQRIHYLGEVRNPVDYMCCGDFFVLASYFEGLPISLLESVSVGCIPIVTPVGGCKDVVSDGRNGFIIDTQKESDIYKTIKRVLHNPNDSIEYIREQTMSDANQYSISHCSDSYLSLFNHTQI